MPAHHIGTCETQQTWSIRARSTVAIQDWHEKMGSRHPDLPAGHHEAGGAEGQRQDPQPHRDLAQQISEPCVIWLDCSDKIPLTSDSQMKLPIALLSVANGILTLVSCGMQTFIPGFVKPFIGTSSCTLFKMLGWGKDIDAREAATTSVQ